MPPQLDPVMFPRIAPPPLSPPVINLVTSARNPSPVDPETGKEVRWQLGFAFEPLPNQDPQLQDPRIRTAGVDQAPSPTVETVPWFATVEDSCSSFGFRAHDFVGRALAGVTAATPKAVEKEFWGGAIAQANEWPNLYLARPAVASRADGFGPIIVNPTPGTAVSVIEGFELLEGALGDCGAGARGMIHAAPEATPNFDNVRREGNLLLTMRDTIVCSGSGYTGEGPAGATNAAPTATRTWLYATSIPIVLLDDPYIESTGGEYEIRTRAARSTLTEGGSPGSREILDMLYQPRDDVGDTIRPYFLDRQTNQVRARARRVVAATWDGICHFACLVNINT